MLEFDVAKTRLAERADAKQKEMGMAGFRLAKPAQGALKMALYGPPGSGKTFSALLIAEGIAKKEGKRVAYVDTERGTDFYSQAIEKRSLHPEAFDFDAIYTRSLSEVNGAIDKINGDDYSVVVIDSITHLWEAAIEGWSGKRTSIGSIPMHAWGEIKEPYKRMINTLLNAPYHVLICGRQKNVFSDDDGEGETKMVGVAMKAEGETAYEPHILIRMVREIGRGKQLMPVSAYVEKDRTGILAGRTISLPPTQEDGFTFRQLGEPFLSVLSGVQGKTESTGEAAVKDQTAALKAKREKATHSTETKKRFLARFSLAESTADLDKISKEITPKLKKRMLTTDVAHVRDAYASRRDELAKEPTDEALADQLKQSLKGGK